MKDIWMYWENMGKTRPEYSNLCIQSIMTRKGNLRLNLLDQDSINQYIPDLCSKWRRLKKATHKVDYIRTRLVYIYGGMWIDCDMAALDSIEPLFDFPIRHDDACQDISQSIGCFIARPGCALLKNVIETKGQTLDEILGNTIVKLQSTRGAFEDNIDHSAATFHFCNESIGPLIQKHVKSNRLTTLNKLISKIFRKALKIDEPVAEEDARFFPFLRRILRQP